MLVVIQFFEAKYLTYLCGKSKFYHNLQLDRELFKTGIPYKNYKFDIQTFYILQIEATCYDFVI